MSAHDSPWYVYALYSYSVGRWYRGIAKQPYERLHKHNQNKGSKYTRGKGPWRLVAVERVANQHWALVFEARVKQLRKAEFLDWVDCHMLEKEEPMKVTDIFSLVPIVKDTVVYVEWQLPYPIDAEGKSTLRRWRKFSKENSSGVDGMGRYYDSKAHALKVIRAFKMDVASRVEKSKLKAAGAARS